MASRVQRKRTRGWTKPEGAVYVGRGSRWGNPYAISRDLPPVWVVSGPGVHSSCLTYRRAAETAVGAYRDWLNTNPEHVEEARRHLAGQDRCPGSMAPTRYWHEQQTTSGPVRVKRNQRGKPPMTDHLPYTYTDPDTGYTLSVSSTHLRIIDDDRVYDEMPAPTGEDAVALARAFLATGGGTGHVVVSREEIEQLRSLLKTAQDDRDRFLAEKATIA